MKRKAQNPAKHKRVKHERVVLEMRDVMKSYQLGKVRVEALRGINLKVYNGDYMAIMGPSGSGKSTLLNMLGCLDVPTTGNILLDNIDISTLTENELARVRGKRVGFVFQTFFLIPHMTALENVELPMMFYDGNSEDRKKKALGFLKKVGLEQRASHKPNELSGGERQRVAIARALMNDPLILFADEPTGNLDSKSGKIIMDIFTELHNEGRTIVTVTHDLDIANQAHHIIRLKDGLVERIEDTDEEVMG